MKRRVIWLAVLSLIVGNSALVYAAGSSETYVRDKAYLLKKEMQEGDVYLFVDNGQLVAGSPQNLAEWQAATWEVEEVGGEYAASMALKFRNIYTGDIIAFSRLADNTLGGTGDVFWTPSSKSYDFTAKNSFFFAIYGHRNEVVVLRPVEREIAKARRYDLIPTLYDNLPAALADFQKGADMFGWDIVDPESEERSISLSANDINTLLNTTGDFHDWKFHALESGTFRIEVKGVAPSTSSPFSGPLQARGLGTVFPYADELGGRILLYSPQMGAYIVEESGILATKTELDDASKRSFLFTYDLATGAIEIFSYGSGNYLNVSTIGNATHFIFGERPDPTRFSLRISGVTQEEYPIWTPLEGLFLLKVKGVNVANGDASVFNRKGKYVRLLPGGELDWIDESPMLSSFPSAHWLLEKDGDKWLRISNRSSAERSTSSHLPGKGIPRKRPSFAKSDFFFLGGDTLECVPLSDVQLRTPSQEFAPFKSGTNSYLFQYLTENTHIIDDGIGLVVGQDVLPFVPEPVCIDTYGDLAGFDLLPTERTAYHLYTIKDGKRRYVGKREDGRYTLLDSAEGSSIFLFRQIRTEYGESQYLIIDIVLLSGAWIELDASGKIKKEYPNGKLIADKASGEKTLLMAGKSATGTVFPQRYLEEDLTHLGERLYPLWKAGLIVPIPVEGSDDVYVGLGPNAEATQVCIKNSTLLTNGPLTHYTLFTIKLYETLRGDDADMLNQPIAGGVTIGSAKGAVVIRGAAGKKVTVVNLQGRLLSRGTVTSAEAFIVAPSGAAIVSVEGEKATTVIVH
ncbi:MAG: DUF6383 domain-containing protein [Tannerellaceae bacterium]|jgi:hypothetical protein|nr:DUF6383 domain-containing protein [Tannerellaceae bacterium]